MESCHLLIQLLGQQVHIVLVLLVLGAVLQDIQLSQHLVGEGAGHHERWMAGGAAKVHQSARCQDNHTVAIREHKAVHLWLDVLNLDAREILQVLHGNLVVKVADVAHNDDDDDDDEIELKQADGHLESVEHKGKLTGA